VALSFRHSYVDRRIFIALTVLAIFSLSTTIVTIESVAHMVSIRQEGVNFYSARTGLGDLMSQLNAAESSQRGYILTENPSYLRPYQSAIKVIPGDLSNVRSLLKPTPYAGWSDALAPEIKAKLAELAQTIGVNDSDGHDAATAIVNQNTGQAVMTLLHTQLSDIINGLNKEIANSQKEVANYAGIAKEVGLLSLGGTLILLAGLYYLFDHAIEAERELDHAKDEFVSLASHQLRTPATGIKSILSMLEQGDFGPLTPKQLDVVRKAVLSNERELGIIEELLNVAKADAGRLVLNPIELDMIKLVEQIATEQNGAFAAKRLKLELKMPDQPVMMFGDEEKLYMAISNLVDNARKYTPNEGKITLILYTQRSHVALEVADNGIGIESHELDHIFDRFQRARMVLAGSIEGTGLGLYLARRIAELHHGTIKVDSKKGQGSIFTLVLPKGS
jgi:signal transduction histidine kinase